MTQLSCVLPARDEAACIMEVVRSTESALRTLTEDHEIIVVDDGSRDTTPQLLQELAASLPQLRVITLGRAGYSMALRTGFREARFPFILFTDADGQIDPAELGSFMPHVGLTRIVVGKRRARAEGLRRHLYSLGYNLCVRQLTGLRVADVNCAMKIFPKRLLDERDLDAEGYLLHVALLLQAKRAGLEVLEVPVSHRPRIGDRSKVRPVADVPRALLGLVSLAERHTDLGRAETRARGKGWHRDGG